MKVLSERLKYLRTKHNLTQPEAGKIIGVQYRTYQKYEYNNTTPPVEALIQFARYYQVSIAYLVGQSDKTTPNASYKLNATLIQRLKILRLQRNLYQKDVALQNNLPYKTYTKYELGERTPNIETLCKLAAFYGVSVDYLVGLDVAE